MVEMNITKISSKGQVVIPVNMRGDFKEGDTLLILKDKNTLLLKKANDLDEQFKEDIEFAKRTEEAYERHEKGQFKTMEFNDFLKEMKTWSC